MCNIYFLNKNFLNALTKEEPIEKHETLFFFSILRYFLYTTLKRWWLKKNPPKKKIESKPTNTLPKNDIELLYFF